MAQTAVIKIKVRSGTLFQWTAANPVLLEGEVGYVTDGPFFVIGDGTSPFLSLSPIQSGVTSVNRYRPEAYIVQNLLTPLQNNLETQITNANNLRVQGDANLQTQITGLQSTVVTIQTNLTAFNQARIDGDALLQTNIDTVYTVLYALEANIKNWYGNGQSNGDLLVYSADNGEFVVLPVGSAGQVLTAGGMGNYPSWETPSGGGSGDMSTAVYDPDLDGIVEAAEREQIQVINKTGSTLTKGTIVYIKTGSSSANYPEVLKANAGTELTSSKTIGAVYEDIANDQTGYIVTSGQVHNLNTAAYQVGQKLWLSTVDGQVTTTPPTQPNHTVFIGHVTRSQSNNGRVLYAIQNGYELHELHDVSITGTPEDGDVLVYSNGLWIRNTIANILGFFPADQLSTENALNAITDVNWLGEYNNGYTYTVGDGVMYNGASYRMIASIGAAGYAPPAYPSHWLQVTDYVTPNSIGLGNVNNTADINKPVSIPVASALSGKEDNIYPLVPPLTDYFWRSDKTWQQIAPDVIGLANVDNTSDLDKPISTATQTALTQIENNSIAYAIALG